MCFNIALGYVIVFPNLESKLNTCSTMNVQNCHVAGYSYVQFLLKSQKSISEYRLWSRTTYGTCINRSVINLGKYTSYALGKHNLSMTPSEQYNN